MTCETETERRKEIRNKKAIYSNWYEGEKDYGLKNEKGKKRKNQSQRRRT